MKVNPNQARILSSAIQNWKQSGQIDEKTALSLQNSMEVATFDWKKLAKYSFWISLICIITSVSAALAGKVLVELLESIFNATWLECRRCASINFKSPALKVENIYLEDCRFVRIN